MVAQQIKSGSSRTRPTRLSLLDIATVVILVFAVWIAFKPGSQLRSEIDRWLADRRIESRAAAKWDEMVAIAMPLYDGDDVPTIIEFSDYECPFCPSQHDIVDSAVMAGARVAIVHIPIERHVNSERASLAALCTKPGREFAKLHDYLLTTDAWKSDSSTEVLANLVRADTSAFRACTQHDQTRDRLAKHVGITQFVAISGTPTFISRHGIVPARPDELGRALRIAGRAR
jgi:hypothetical protein